MKKRTLGLLLLKSLLILLLSSCSGTGSKSISILETTDVHGVILPYDYIEKEKIDVSMASSLAYIRQIRKEKDATILLDNGDNLQGQPEVYYYNFIDTVSPHFLTEIMNYMGYDAGTVGNHDIEAGHAVYDRLVKEYNFPLLAANAIDIKSGKPYFKPYYIIEKRGLKIAVFGLVTPAIPNWLPQELYAGIEFQNMVETAKLWMPIILHEKPDLVVGLFHSGWDRSNVTFEKGDQLYENGSAAVAYNVPGFDVIFNGHDHRVANEQFINMVGDTILILNGGSRSEKIAQADIVFSSMKINGNREKKITGKIINVSDFEPDPEFISKFKPQHEKIDSYVNQVIGNSSATISSRDSYFGSSAFVDGIHSIQLEITGADISFAAPLSFDVQIPEGPITVGDMFKLYRFENMLYTMTLSGEEVHKYLEFSYSKWFNKMNSPGDELLKLRTGKDGKPLLTNGRAYLRNQPYNFDSAAGIDYTVDVTKPEGKRVVIKRFTGGKPFEKSKMYKVAVNSYRGNGGGGHFTEGAGIDKDELRSRLLSSTDRDLRYYILKSIETKKTVTPEPLNNWKIIPERFVKAAIPRDYKMLFGNGK
ncbi:MAG TPA: bifunctional UDP-sugar hydrolase/5'-nucleotidase [Bacteroidales bacterium]|nr:bifunctional UDP-sugar hydrolase/5'-nucleotidase [Bacteroidales bacterium]